MWSHLLRYLTRVADYAFTLGGTSRVGFFGLVVLPPMISGLEAIYKTVKTTGSSWSKAFKQAQAGSLFRRPVVIIWLCVVAWSFAAINYQDHQGLVQAKRTVISERNQANVDRDKWKGKFESIPQAKEVPPVPISKPRRLTAPESNSDARFSVSQKTLVTTRTDAPNHIRVVVQTTVDFPSLKFILKCTQPIVEAGGGVRADLVTYQGSGINPNDNRSWMFFYGTSFPPFGPDNPMVIDIWSATPNECRDASTY